jgi:hypothetical protein
MRSALKECLGDVKRTLKGKRMGAYGKKGGDDESSGDSDGAEASAGSGESGARGTSGAEKALRTKVASAEASAHEEMQEAGDWREDDVKQFMKKRKAPKPKRSGTFASVVSTAKAGKGGKKG